MLDTKIEKLILNMTEDINENLKIIENEFLNIKARNSYLQTLLHILVDNLHNEEKHF